MPGRSLGIVFIELQTFNVCLYLLSPLRFEREQVEQTVQVANELTGSRLPLAAGLAGRYGGGNQRE